MKDFDNGTHVSESVVYPVIGMATFAAGGETYCFSAENVAVVHDIRDAMASQWLRGEVGVPVAASSLGDLRTQLSLYTAFGWRLLSLADDGERNREKYAVWLEERIAESPVNAKRAADALETVPVISGDTPDFCRSLGLGHVADLVSEALAARSSPRP